MEIPDEFCLIEPYLYHARRCPSFCYTFLASLKLRTLIYMDSGQPRESLRNFAEQNNIEIISFESQPWRSAQDIQQLIYCCETLSFSLKYVLHTENYPIMVIGSNILTGVVRKAQNWTMSAVLGDYNAYSSFNGQNINSEGSTFIEMLELEFGKTENFADRIQEHVTNNPLKPLIAIDLPSEEHRPDWVKRYLQN